MQAKSAQQSYSTDERNTYGQRAVNVLVGGQKVRENRRQREQYRSEQAVENAKRGSPGPDSIGQRGRTKPCIHRHLFSFSP
jgi:hypothetical protein